MGGSSGGGGSAPAQSTNTVQQADPWSGQQAALHNIFGLGTYLAGAGDSTLSSEQRDAYATGADFVGSDRALSYYGGDTVAPFSDETRLAQEMQTLRSFGSPLEAAGQGQLTTTLGGTYLGEGNPYFRAMMDRVSNDIRPRLDAQFGSSGRLGSGLHQAAMADALSDTAGQLAFQNYGDERTNMMRAAFAAPQLSQLDYQNIAALSDVGVQRENLEQARINEQIERHNFQQMEPYTRLGLYNQFVQGNYGGQGSATTTGTGSSFNRGGSTFGSALGGGAAGAGLAAALGAGPWGIGAAALGGGLLGLF